MKPKNRGVTALKSRYGMLFTAHWTFGLIVFFIVPLITSIYFAFASVSIVPNGIDTEFVGLDNFKYLLLEDAKFIKNLRADLVSLVYSVPIIVALSLIQAVVLNGRYRGRLFARAMFFIPVITASSAVMAILQSSYVMCPVFYESVAETKGGYTDFIDFVQLFQNLNIPAALTKMFSDWFTNLFSLIWACGVQTVLFISGLQTIPTSLYEVSKVEGANKWEDFWFITLPMLGNILILVVAFTLIEFFISPSNQVMSQVLIVMNTSQIYDRSSAMMWLYFVVAGFIIAVVLALYNRFCLKRWN